MVKVYYVKVSRWWCQIFPSIDHNYDKHKIAAGRGDKLYSYVAIKLNGEDLFIIGYLNTLPYIEYIT